MTPYISCKRLCKVAAPLERVFVAARFHLKEMMFDVFTEGRWKCCLDSALWPNPFKLEKETASEETKPRVGMRKKIEISVNWMNFMHECWRPWYGHMPSEFHSLSVSEITFTQLSCQQNLKYNLKWVRNQIYVNNSVALFVLPEQSQQPPSVQSK